MGFGKEHNLKFPRVEKTLLKRKAKLIASPGLEKLGSAPMFRASHG
jgi:hypothetical protein